MVDGWGKLYLDDNGFGNNDEEVIRSADDNGLYNEKIDDVRHLMEGLHEKSVIDYLNPEELG